MEGICVFITMQILKTEQQELEKIGGNFYEKTTTEYSNYGVYGIYYATSKCVCRGG